MAKIPNKYTGNIICEDERLNIRDLVDLHKADLHKADLRGADLHKANLCEANLCEADLCEADLREADLDFSCWPLWCGSMNVKVDLIIVQQLAAHLCALDCKNKEYQDIKRLILPFAQKSHRANDLNLINKDQ